MRNVTIHEPLAARIVVVQDGRPRGGQIIASRQVEGGALEVAVSLDPLEEHGPRDLLRFPASEVWVDEEAHARWADSETRARLAEELRLRAEEARGRCVCGHVRRRHHVGGGDDAGCTECDCAAYVDALETLRRERDEALADLAESRRAFERAVDDQQIEDASTAEKIATLTRERDEAIRDRHLAWERLDRLRAALREAGVPSDDLGLDEMVAHVIRERDEARELWRREETRMREAEWALDAAGVSATAPMPPGVAGCQTFSVAERIGTLAAQRDEARQSDDAWDLLDRWAVILDDLIDKAGISYDPAGGREEAAEKLAAQFASLRADAARLRGALDAKHQALERLTHLYESEQDAEALDRVGRPDWLRAALAGEREAKRCAWKEDQDGVWHTACGSSWVYLDCDGAPADHGQKFCHACGHQLDATPFAHEEEEEEEEPAPEVPYMGPQVVDVPAPRAAEEVRDA